MRERIGTTLWLLTMAALGAWFAVMAVDYEPPYEYLDAAHGSRIVPNPAPAGETVSTDWKLSEVARDCPRTVERIFTDRESGRVVTTLDALPLSQTVRTSETSISRSFNLPYILPAKTDYHVIVRFRCNVLQSFFPIEVTSPKLPIDIIPN